MWTARRKSESYEINRPEPRVEVRRERGHQTRFEEPEVSHETPWIRPKPKELRQEIPIARRYQEDTRAHLITNYNLKEAERYQVTSREDALQMLEDARQASIRQIIGTEPVPNRIQEKMEKRKRMLYW